MKSGINGKQSWASIVNTSTKQNFYPHTINTGQESSLSSLSQNNYKSRKEKGQSEWVYTKNGTHTKQKRITATNYKE